MLDQLFGLNPWIAYGFGIVIVLAAAEFGGLIGIAWRRKHPEPISPVLFTLVGASFGLLSLMIGFTFSIALSRFDARLDAVVNEANAIGTTALRARMLPEPHASEVKKLLRDYVELRVELTRARQSSIPLEQAVGRSNEIQAELWQHAIAVNAADPRSTGLFVLALNEMIDLQETRLAARLYRVPAVVFVLLYAIAMVAIGLCGYVGGLGERRKGRIPVAIMAVTVASVIGLVGDLDRSQSGFIIVGQQAMHNLGESLDR